MSILAALAKAYERLPDAPPFGYARIEAGFCIVLKPDGTIAYDPIDLRSMSGKKKIGIRKNLPSPLCQRTSGIKPNFLWDKSAYSLGVTAGKNSRTSAEQKEFAVFHNSVLADSDDIGLIAFKNFIKYWKSEYFDELKWDLEIKDENIVFALEGHHRQGFIHETVAAKAIWAKIMATEKATEAVCLVRGARMRIARSHPPIKGVTKAQSSGAFIVSYNSNAYESYGHQEGDNAPVSEAAVFAYTTALNRFLERDSGHRIQIGDASTVFWADSRNADLAALAENAFALMCVDAETEDDEPKIDDKAQSRRVGDLLEQIRLGRHVRDFDPELAKGVRFFVLGLAPNAARLSIRYWFDDDFGVLADHYGAYLRDIAFEPWPKERRRPSIRTLVLRTAPARLDRSGKVSFATDDISPLLAGELLRSILTGARFPGALLGLLILRIRSDHLIDSTRVALIKAIIVRDMRLKQKLIKDEETYLVRSDPDDPNPARRLGRLFALIERAQLAALGDDINTTVKDKFLGSAAATPLQVFVGLENNARHHLKRLRNGHSDASWIKDSDHARKVGAGLERDIGRIWSGMVNNLPQQHSVEEQGLFFIGYYQERFGTRSGANPAAETRDGTESETGDGE